MGTLDFKRATDLFLGTEQELSLALGVAAAELRTWRKEPRRVPTDVLERLGAVLEERGRGMARVGEMLREQAVERRSGNGAG
jgi:hypothetical protein